MSRNIKIIVASVALLLAALYLPNIIDTFYDDGSRPSIQTLDDLPRVSHNEQGNFNPFVRLIDAKSGRGFCSGTVISDQYVLTAGHCLHENGYLSKRKIHIGLANGETLSNIDPVVAVPAALSLRVDLGLVKGEFKGFAHLPINTREIEAYFSGVQTIAIGFPMNAKLPTYSKFVTAGMVPFMLAGYGMLFPGMSGGPVLALTPMGPIIIAVNTAVGNGAVYITPTISALAIFGLEE